VLFQIILSSVLLGSISVVSAVSGVGEFFYVVIAAVLFGSFMGYMFSLVIGQIRNIFAVEMTLTLILAHVTFIITEHFIHASGIIATVFAGLVVGGYGRSKISPQVRETMEHFWVYGAFVVNSLIFLLIGLSIKDVNFKEFILAAIIGIVVVLFSRAVSVFSVFPILNKITKEEKTPFAWQALLSWGGLRGALALAIALLLPNDFEYKDFILSLTLVIILFSLIVQATTMKRFIKRLKIDVLSDEESFEIEEGFVFVDETVREKLKEMFESGSISEKIYKKLDKKYSSFEDQSKVKIENIIKHHGKDFSHDEMIAILKRQALGTEKRVLYTLFTNFEIGESTFNKLNAKLNKQTNRLQRGHAQLSSDDENEIQNLLFKFSNEIVDLCKRKGFFVDSIERREVSMVVNRYRMLRARILISKEVIIQLKKVALLNNFVNEEALNDVISQYENFENKNSEEIESLRSSRPNLSYMIDYSIANNASIRMEKSVVFDLNQNGIIGDKVCQDVSEYLDDLIHKKSRTVRKYLANKKNKV